LRILIAPDSFKESLSASQAVRAIARGVSQVFPGARCTHLPFSDGGEGAFDLLTIIKLGQTVITQTTDPLNRELRAPIFVFNDEKTAWIELSQASGIALLNAQEKNPIETTTFGTGLQILAALDRGIQKIIIGIGGSATHDLGMGIFAALGGKILDQNHRPIPNKGGGLSQAAVIDTTLLDPRIKKTTFIFASDVTNPLLGPLGAATVYAPQKGARPDQISIIESYTKNMAALIEMKTGTNIASISGGGAAGGTAAGLLPFLNASLCPGFELLASFSQLDEKIKAADLIITGEGHLDEQTFYGKLISQIASRARDHQKPVWAYAGSVSASQENCLAHGIQKAFSITPQTMDFEMAKKQAATLLEQKVVQTLKKTKWQ